MTAHSWVWAPLAWLGAATVVSSIIVIAVVCCSWAQDVIGRAMVDDRHRVDADARRRANRARAAGRYQYERRLVPRRLSVDEFDALWDADGGEAWEGRS